MDKFGIKATLYDLIGYALPGAFFIIGLYVLTTLPLHFDVEQILKFEISKTFAVGLLFSSYLSGYFLSSFSSFIFENKLVWWVAKNIYDINTQKYDKKAQKLFGKNYADCGIRTPIAYCQKNDPVIYETAFSFLSIYGLSRNIAAAMLILLPFAIEKFYISQWIMYYGVALIFIIHNYFRFKVYYIHQIASAIMTSE